MATVTIADQAAIFVWWSSLAVGLAVALVVAFLLSLIHSTAVTINEVVSKIWDTGQRVANNTIQIPILYRINTAAGKILTTAVQIIDGAAAIETHAEGCPGCPHCMLEH